MSEYVTRLLRRDLSRPSIEDWIAAQGAGGGGTRTIDVVRAMDAVRVEYEGAHGRSVGGGEGGAVVQAARTQA